MSTPSAFTEFQQPNSCFYLSNIYLLRIKLKCTREHSCKRFACRHLGLSIPQIALLLLLSLFVFHTRRPERVNDIVHCPRSWRQISVDIQHIDAAGDCDPDIPTQET
tara:strand:+ start:2448 stop:2768 length:321 start_codon:yes stop_codon:yes gene_type:complete